MIILLFKLIMIIRLNHSSEYNDANPTKISDYVQT